VHFVRLATTLLKDEAMCRERSFSQSDGGETMKEICVCLRPMQQWIFIEQVCVQLPTSADNVTLLAFAAAERRAAVRRVIDRYLLPAGPTAANPPQRYAVVDRWDRQTDRRTPYRFTDPAHTVRALSDMTVCVSGARRWLQSVVRP